MYTINDWQPILDGYTKIWHNFTSWEQKENFLTELEMNDQLDHHVLSHVEYLYWAEKNVLEERTLDEIYMQECPDEYRKFYSSHHSLC